MTNMGRQGVWQKEKRPVYDNNADPTDFIRAGLNYICRYEQVIVTENITINDNTSSFCTEAQHDHRTDDVTKTFAPVRKCAATDNFKYEKRRCDKNYTFHFIQIST